MPRFGNNKKMSDSPLLNNGVETRTTTTSNSTIHPERLDMSRFSERVEEEESSFRIVLYVVAVIIIGVALALFVRYMIQRNENTAKQPETQTPQDNTPEETAVKVNTTALADSAVANAPKNSDMSDKKTQTVGTAVKATETVKLDTIEYQKYTTFGRIAFKFSGTTTVPSTKIDFANNQLVLTLDQKVTINELIKSSTAVNDLISTITYSAVTKVFTLELANPSKYRIISTGTELVIDVKTLAQIATDAKPATTGSDNTDSTDTSGGTDTPADPNKPTGVNLTNEFSKVKQYITSNVTGNTISYNETYYEDQGTYFEIAWGSRNNVGDKFITNATAEMVKESGKVFIDVTINNLKDLTTQEVTDASNISIPLSGANFVRSELKSFKNGVAKFRIEIKKEADFKLMSDKTVSGATQVLSLQIRD